LCNGYLINEEMGMRHGETINSWELETLLSGLGRFQSFAEKDMRFH
jgi:hypothetical protein